MRKFQLQIENVKTGKRVTVGDPAVLMTHAQAVNFRNAHLPDRHAKARTFHIVEVAQ